MGFLAGKRLLITGVLNNRSLAYGIARACHREGAELAFSYQGERFKERIAETAAEFGSTLTFDCDVADDAQIERLFAQLGEHWDAFDGFVHAIAFAPRESIGGDFLDGLSRAELPGRRALRAQLQHDGPGQGVAGGQRALHGTKPGA
jgi:enoyl-[acyl-carrier protein] reductase I